MANCDDAFKRFNNSISLNSLEKKYLRKARTAITTKVINKFSVKPQIPTVKFKVQGSFTMNTIVRPISGEFDIDIGVHFDFDPYDRENWPSPYTVSGWLCEALAKHTTEKPDNKTTCVRITYKPIKTGADYGYHVDLPIYGEYEDEWGDRYTAIGMNDERGWNEISDPLGFTDWFNEKCKSNSNDKKQLIRIVKYLKAWKDFKTSNIKMPSGMILTILAGKNYEASKRDDVALYNLLVSIHYLLWWYFSIIKPVAPKNNLVKFYSEAKENFFMRKLKEFRDDAEMAINANNKEEAIGLWRKHLGDRFF